MLTAMFGLASLLTAFALGFVLGRVWEIRQEMRSKAEAQAVRSTPVPTASQLNNRFWGAF